MVNDSRYESGSRPGYVIRPLQAREEMLGCIEIQRDTWGRDFSDVVPVSMLQVSVKMGGVLLGAFAPDGSLVGFVFGVTGLRDGQLAHWSHMLAVQPWARNLGIGRRLKLRQRRSAPR